MRNIQAFIRGENQCGGCLRYFNHRRQLTRYQKHECQARIGADSSKKAYPQFQLYKFEKDKWTPTCLFCGVEDPQKSEYSSQSYHKLIDHIITDHWEDFKILGYDANLLKSDYFKWKRRSCQVHRNDQNDNKIENQNDPKEDVVM